MGKYILAALIFLNAVGVCLGQHFCFDPSSNFSELKSTGLFEASPDTLGIIKQKEISGITYSIRYPDHFWGISDSGNGAVLYLYSGEDATLKHLFILNGLNNTDWEDLSLAREGNTGMLYIPDFGDNQAKRNIYTVYKIEEPEITTPDKKINNLTISPERIKYKYAEGPRDAESIAYDPIDSCLYITTKRESMVNIYRLSTEQKDSIQHISSLGTLPLTNVVGTDFSPDGMQFILKTYTNVYLWMRESEDESFCSLISKDPYFVNYQLEPQGESICFINDSFITVSEERFGITPMLYQYKAAKTD